MHGNIAISMGNHIIFDMYVRSVKTEIRVQKYVDKRVEFKDTLQNPYALHDCKVNYLQTTLQDLAK